METPTWIAHTGSKLNVLNQSHKLHVIENYQVLVCRKQLVMALPATSFTSTQRNHHCLSAFA